MKGQRLAAWAARIGGALGDDRPEPGGGGRLPLGEPARPDQLRHIEVEAGGYGLGDARLDADGSVPRLLADPLGSTLNWLEFHGPVALISVIIARLLE
jgi:hypothetical protein